MRPSRELSALVRRDDAKLDGRDLGEAEAVWPGDDSAPAEAPDAAIRRLDRSIAVLDQLIALLREVNLGEAEAVSQYMKADLRQELGRWESRRRIATAH